MEYVVGLLTGLHLNVNIGVPNKLSSIHGLSIHMLLSLFITFRINIRATEDIIQQFTQVQEETDVPLNTYKWTLKE